MQKSYRRWYYSHGLCLYLDNEARVEKALYLDDDFGIVCVLYPMSLELTGEGYENSSNRYGLECFFRKNSRYGKHVLATATKSHKYNPDTQKLERWL